MIRTLLYSSFFLLILTLTACTKVDIRFGDQYLDNGNTQIVMNDTFQVALANIHIDSFGTSGSGVSLIGGYDDPLFGKITVSNYFELALQTYNDIYQDATYDSLELILTPNQQYFGDTTAPVQINVHRLDEAIVAYNESAIIYNTQQFAVFTTPLAQASVWVRPLRADTISIRLNDQFGRALFTKLQNPSDPEINSVAGFIEYMKGLRVSSTTRQLLVGYKDSVKMRLHYTKPGLYKQELFTDFTLNNTAHHFNNISVNRTGTALQQLNSQTNEISSTQTGNTAYIQYASGVMAKLRFPTIREILKVPHFVKILQAKLVVRPVHGTYEGVYSLPPSLRLAQTNLLNQIGADISVQNSSGENVTQTGNLQIDFLYGRTTQYTYDVTEYIQTVLATATENRDGLLLLPPWPSYTNDFRRLLIGDRLHPDNKIELQIYYATVK